MEIILVRHGLSMANKKDILGGNSSLAPEGKEQAQDLARRLSNLKIDVIYCSPLRRTSETALPIAEKLGLELNIDHRLAEVDWGEFSGKSEEELLKKVGMPPREYLSTYKYDFTPYGGESSAQVESRVKSFLEDLKKKPYKLVLIVSHGGIVRWLHYLITGEKITWQPNAEEIHLKT